ncbi:MAG TPA: type I-U CRISPR-associated protein Csb2 [Streptosporangiaceae bacterium]|nr:type I-U CRISPR-associated protein Csb2 [Streptosporangiaceae bacterium]
MSTTLAVSFPIRRYHANAWDRAVNEGATEWPPAPWRILRALVATWHTRWPDLPAATLDGLLEALADPPCYRTPNVVAGHTRHYLPDLEHRKGEQGHTDLTLDPFLALAPGEDLLIRWDVTLDAGQRQVLAKLAELLPYLGRSESVCEARLLDEETEPDESWWRPGTDGETRLLAITRPVTRAALEATTTDVRRHRHTVPPATRWVSYVAGETSPYAMPRRAIETSDVTAIRFAVTGRVPMKATHGLLLADRAHEKAGTALKQAEIPDPRRAEIMGTRGAGTDHAHAHWIALPGSEERGASVQNLVIWCRGGLRTDEVRALLSLGGLSGRRGDYEVSGFPDVELLFQAAGPVELVVPELCKPSRRWRSRTPYLPVRHRKRETQDEYVAADVAAELRYRGKPTAVVSPVEPGSGTTDRWANEFRRHRLQERLARSRPGMGLRLEFAKEIEGPLLLGQLSHFGYGVFVPDEDFPGVRARRG